MQKAIVISVGFVMGMAMFLSSCHGAQEMPQKCHLAAHVCNRWRLGIQAWTFNRFTFYEAVDKTASLGLDWIEAFPGQKLSKEKPNAQLVHTMSPQSRDEVKHKLAQAGVKLVNYGVVSLPNDESKCRKVFDFARDMGIETIVSEPPEDALDLIDRLCQEYNINIAIHNHPEPSHYWNPDAVLKACQGRSKRIGACADTGHWMRSGINPVEALKKLQGRIISLHFKDINEFGKRRAHDVVWGTGVGNAKAMLAELHRQNFKGVFSIEYEHKMENNIPEIRQSVEYYNEAVSDLDQEEWTWLFNGKDLTGWDGDPRLWSVKNGAIHGETTKENYPKNNTFLIWRGGKLRDFELRLKFRIENGNSGVQFRSRDRSADRSSWSVSGYQAEVCNEQPQIGFLYEESTGRGRLVHVGDFVVIDKTGKKHVVGKVADPAALVQAGYYKPRQWNNYTIIARGNHIIQKVNGHKTIELIDNDPIGSARQGILALQIHTGPPMVVEFKDIRVKQFHSQFHGANILFNGKDLTGWTARPGSWVVEPGGVLFARGKGHIWTKEQFGDFILDLEFKLAKNSNSGIFFRTADIRNEVQTGIEMQVYDTYGKRGIYDTSRNSCGAIYDCMAPSRNVVNKPGQWNHVTITAVANWINIVMNDTPIIDMNLDLWTEAHKNPDGTKNKFRTAQKNMPRVGHIGLQYHNDPIWYRNIRIIPLNK